MRKRFFAGIICLAMLFALLPAGAVAETLDEPARVLVLGTDVSKEGTETRWACIETGLVPVTATDTDWDVAFTPAADGRDAVLTLKNANLIVPTTEDVYKVVNAIQISQKPVTIKLIGKNGITANGKESDNPVLAINSGSSIAFVADNAASLDIGGNKIRSIYFYYADCNMSIGDNVSLTINGATGTSCISCTYGELIVDGHLTIDKTLYTGIDAGSIKLGKYACLDVNAATGYMATKVVVGFKDGVDFSDFTVAAGSKKSPVPVDSYENYKNDCSYSAYIQFCGKPKPEKFQELELYFENGKPASLGGEYDYNDESKELKIVKSGSYRLEMANGAIETTHTLALSDNVQADVAFDDVIIMTDKPYAVDATAEGATLRITDGVLTAGTSGGEGALKGNICIGATDGKVFKLRATSVRPENWLSVDDTTIKKDEPIYLELIKYIRIARAYNVKGSTTDERGNSLSGCTMLVDGYKPIELNPLGSFSTLLDLGTHTVTVTRQGYEKLVKEITVTPDSPSIAHYLFMQKTVTEEKVVTEPALSVIPQPAIFGNKLIATNNPDITVGGLGLYSNSQLTVVPIAPDNQVIIELGRKLDLGIMLEAKDITITNAVIPAAGYSVTFKLGEENANQDVTLLHFPLVGKLADQLKDGSGHGLQIHTDGSPLGITQKVEGAEVKIDNTGHLTVGGFMSASPFIILKGHIFTQNAAMNAGTATTVAANDIPQTGDSDGLYIGLGMLWAAALACMGAVVVRGVRQKRA